MSQVQVISATCPIDFGLSSSPIQDTLSISYQEKKLSWTTDLVSNLISTSPPITRGVHYENAADDDRPLFPSLPPLLRGHPSTHMRNGIMRAYRLAAANVPDAEKAFFVADLSVVYAQHERWKRCLPQVEPFYAVKCNPDPYVLRLLAALGTGFDCASNGEINEVLKLGIDPSRIIFANPCKAASFVRGAAKAGVDLMTFDNADELHKVARAHPGARLVVRILTDDSKSVCRLGIKFGAPLASVPGLLATARALGLDVVGVSFHVGSGCYDAHAFVDAVARARAAFDMGREAGYVFSVLDVGGGFEDGNFEETAGVLGGALDLYFPEREGVRVIAEPGRFYVARAFSLAVNIIARRAGDGGEMDADQPAVMYYINDGVYGAFNCILFDHQRVQPYVLSLGGSFHVPEAAMERAERCSVWGPTCDSIDCVCAEVRLPGALQVGDWLGFEGMGAYTICAASGFNGFEVSAVVYTCGGGPGAAEVRAVLAGFAARVDCR